ncbi:hypothetical protein JHL21_07080 [Devosia sp. WQ 349]|uniref:DUF6683 family protein n=1 Tax=Devosia sp. WQ 349K1 TaxID=2800329 RepID=UPI001902CCA7|nr:DUF6683 family protein [Devosia sp. WQ 349K1]MBK1794261.1 hypothetical protein [Devosia sp. WQ 349K1]
MRILASLLFFGFSLTVGIAQEATSTAPMAPTEEVEDETFDTSYHFSPTTSARIEREFLEEIRWSAGVEARDNLREAFEKNSALDTWQELVAKDGLELGNVADALTSYWILNWITANGAYSTKVDNSAVQTQLRAAFSIDPAFAQLSDQQKQIMAETYIRHFLVEHAALNAAVKAKDITALEMLAAASVLRFRNDMSVDLLALEPGPKGFDFKPLPDETSAEN